jgi:hypothetical protein
VNSGGSWDADVISGRDWQNANRRFIPSNILTLPKRRAISPFDAPCRMIRRRPTCVCGTPHSSVTPISDGIGDGVVLGRLIESPASRGRILLELIT